MSRRLLFRASVGLLAVLARRRDATALAFGIRLLETQLRRDPVRNLPLLQQCAGSPEWLHRFIAARTAGDWLRTDPEAAGRLILALAPDPDGRVREGVGEGLAAVWERSAADAQPLVQALLRHPVERARLSLALMLIPLIRRAASGPRAYQPLLDQLLEDPGGAVQGVLGHLVIARTLALHDRAGVRRVFAEAVARRRRRPALELAAASLRKLYPAEAPLMATVAAYEALAAGATDFVTTAELPVPGRLIDQVLGQDHAVALVKRAAVQKRSLLLIGDPGTGKSLLGAALAELLPAGELEDVLAWPNEDDRTTPRIESVPAGEGKRIRNEARRRARHRDTSVSFVFGFLLAGVALVGLFWYVTRGNGNALWAALAVAAALLVGRGHVKNRERVAVPKLLRQAPGAGQAPFIEATGFHAGGLLGDVRHDPYQSGGVETAPHELLEVGAIHQAHRGVLFIDEVSTLGIESQQGLLTAFQERKLAVTGRSPGSSGTMVRSGPIPCDFILMLAGNDDDVGRLHPALRSRIRGYGYEIAMHTTMADTPDHRHRLARFVATEVRKDGRIPHFSRAAVEAIVAEARRRANQPGRLTARLRELGGLVRAAGDLAVESGAALVEPSHVGQAREFARPFEAQRRAGAAAAAPATVETRTGNG